MFRYSAAGQKVAKLVYQTGKPHPLRTDYLGPYQYEQDSLRFFPHAEGRVLRFANTTSGAVRYEREFTFKDHLGNLRLAYRAGQRHLYQATLEQDAATHARESQQFDSLSVSPPVAQAVGPLARTGSYAARLNAGGATPHPLGPLTQFAVQKGDTLFVTAPGRYQQATGTTSFAFSLAGFVASLLQPASGAPPGLDNSRRGGLPLLQVGLSSATLLGLTQLPGGVPKGYLRVLSFSEDSVLVDQRTVQLTAAALGNYETLSTGQLIVQQNGYVSVYVGNESAVDVYFDDLTIEHRQGLQVQENHYDPFGLDLAGVSGAAPGLRLKNFYQFNGKENQLDLGLNWNHQDWRFFDCQLGQWHVVDPEIENGQASWTPYSFGYDNAIRYADANGRNPGGGGGPTLAQVDPSAVANELALLWEEAAPVLQNFATAIGLTAAAAWVGNHLPSAEQVGNALSHTSAGAAAPPGMYSPYMQHYLDGKMQVANRQVNSNSGKAANGRVNANQSQSSKPGGYSHVKDKLPRAKGGAPEADPAATGPHTRLGKSSSSPSAHNQAAEFDDAGKPVKEVDFTDHGSPGAHPDPHEHRIDPAEPQYHKARGKPDNLNPGN